MVQSVLIFLLGFAFCALLAFMIAPSIWRRAVKLTEKRIEASVPLTMNEIQAEKDKIRASFAVESRKLEMSHDAMKEKISGFQIKVDQQRDQISTLESVRDQKITIIEDLEQREIDIRETLGEREKMLGSTRKTLRETENTLKERLGDITDLEAQLAASRAESDERRIEIVARETEIDNRNDRIARLTGMKEDAEAMIAQLREEVRGLNDEIVDDRKREGELKKRLDKIQAELADREDTLSRRERQLKDLGKETEKTISGLTQDIAGMKEAAVLTAKREAQLKHQHDEIQGQLADREDKLSRREAQLRELKKQSDGVIASMKSELQTNNDAGSELKKRESRMKEMVTRLEGELATSQEKLQRREQKITEIGGVSKGLDEQVRSLSADLTKTENRRAKLEAELGKATDRLERVLNEASSLDLKAAASTASPANKARVKELEKQLLDVQTERDALRIEKSTIQLSSGGGREEERKENAQLRERINQLAAQVTALTSESEGSGSLINSILGVKNTSGNSASPRNAKVAQLRSNVKNGGKQKSTNGAGTNGTNGSKKPVTNGKSAKGADIAEEMRGKLKANETPKSLADRIRALQVTQD